MECDFCGEPGMSLGVLGNLEWFRCRDCGNQWSNEATEDHDEQEDED